MTSLPDDVVKRIPPLHTQDNLPDNQLTAYARLTLKDAGLTWFLLELHTDQDTFSAYLVDPRQEQFGYFSFSYLEEHLGIAALDVLGEIPGEGFILGLEELPSAIEYDHSFTPKPLIGAVKTERVARHAKGPERRSKSIVTVATTRVREISEKPGRNPTVRGCANSLESTIAPSLTVGFLHFHG